VNLTVNLAVNLVMNAKVSKFLTNSLKISIVAGLLGWMISSGKLDLKQLKIFLEPIVLIVSVAVWVVNPLLLGTCRWWLLLKGANLECNFKRAMLFQTIGFFFNTAMPGAVGGDLIKAIYIVKDQKIPSGKTAALLTVLLDRVVGLIGLFVMGSIAALVYFNQIKNSAFAVQMMTGLKVVAVVSAFFLALVFVKYPNGKDPIDRLLNIEFFVVQKIRGIYLALRIYANRPYIFFGTILISVVIQAISLTYMWFLGNLLYPGFDGALLSAVYPFGVLATALPLAPGGLGVGHAAFERLFSMVGLPGGANVFNAATISMLFMNLLCFIPYLLIKADKKESRLMAEVENDLERDFDTERTQT
jgi:uncharacterized protein (TIRG00374 family)